MSTRRGLLTFAAAAAISIVGVTPARAHASPHSTASADDPALAELAIDVRPDANIADDTVDRFGPTTGGEVAITNAATWHAAGIDGTGVKIGVIDFFDVAKHWNVTEHGPMPVAGVTAMCLNAGVDCTPELFDGVAKGDDDHGLAVVEAIKDMAPGAEIYIARALTVSDYRAVVDWLAAAGVSILNRSLGSRYDGPGDGRGGIDGVAAYAVTQGMVWINSAGNAGTSRYYRQPVRLVGDRVAFGPTGSETFLKANGCLSLGGVRWANDWDKPASQRTDYDVFVWDAPLNDPEAGSVVASSTERQRSGAAPIENIAEQYCPSGPTSVRSLYLEVHWRGGDPTGDVLEILDYGAGMAAHTQTPQSAAVGISDSDEPGVLAIGAIDPPASGTIAAYSSQGPTNDGRLAPDISITGSFASTVKPGGFAGTSAASAVASGAAALLLDAELASGPRSLANLIRHVVTDRGPAGPDNAYGYGELRLPPPPLPVDATPSAFVPLTAPQRVLDTRPESAVGPANLIGRVAAGEIRDLPILGQAGVPSSGVTAVAVNVTAVDIDQPTFVQALPTWRAAIGGYSNINTDRPRQIRANFAIVPIGDNGTISLYTIASGDLVVDVLGYFTGASQPVAAGRFVELPPQRVLDTRTDGVPLADRVPRAVPSPAGVDMAQVQALVMTVTGTSTTESGWIQAFPTDRPDIVAGTSTVNLVPGTSVANTAIIPVGSRGVSVTGWFGTGSGHVVVDVVGYITSESAPIAGDGRYVPVRPGRAFDSRTSTGDLTVAVPVEINAASAPGVAIPADATGVVWNLAALDARQPGFGRVWAADAPQPATSAFNWSFPGETRAASVIASVDNGRVRVVLDNGSGNPTSIAAGLIADVFGYFT
jgi:hypothetical protein